MELITRNGEGMVLEKFTRALAKELSLDTKERTEVRSLCDRRNRGKMDGDAAYLQGLWENFEGNFPLLASIRREVPLWKAKKELVELREPGRKDETASKVEA